ncbi:AAA family ATPase [Kitasatospora sp. NPDC001175]|uniref:AAA family ATPase n=1 Tax=Kitasatospora sp. NPDC001175 TaxID=3157103 RepID=UPI003D05DFC2
MSNVHRFPAPDEDDGSYIDRSVPVDLAAEQAVLSACMYDPTNVGRVSFLDRSDFYRAGHQLVWDLLQQQAAAGQPTHPIALHAEIERLGQLRLVDGGSYLFTICQAPNVSADYYAAIVQEKARLRRKTELAVRLSVEAQRGSSPEHLDDLIREHLEDEVKRAGGGVKGAVESLLAEMLDTTALDNMPSLESLVGDLLHLDTLARIIGPSGHMKSFVTIDIAGHVGTGKPWHGRPVRQGTVVYLVAEGARGIRKRVRAWERHHGVRMDNVLFLPRPVQAMDPEWLVLIEACRRLDPVLVVVDTQARVSVGVEENSAKELGLVVDRMEQLRSATGGCVLLIHHTGHQGEHGRGSTSAKGALQSELHVSKKGEALSTVVTVKTGKQKDDEEGPDIEFGLHIVDIPGETKPDGRPVTSVVLVELDGFGQAARPVQPGSVEWVVAELDRTGVPPEWGGRRVVARCAELGIRARKDKIEEAIRVRKNRSEMPGLPVPPNVPPTSPAILNENVPPAPGDPHTKPQVNRPPNQRGDTGGTPLRAERPPTSLLREGGRPPGDTPCTRCGKPLPTDWQARGYDTHIICNTHGDAA